MSSDLPVGDKPRRAARGGFAAAAAMLVLIVAAGIFVAVHHPAAGAGTRAAGTPIPGSTTSPGAQPGGAPADSPSVAGGCHPSDTDQAVPSAPPPGVTWSLVDTVALPASPSAGPLQVRGEVATCFARTPTGALLAAAQTSTRYLLAQDWRAVVAASVVPDAGAAAYAAARAKASVPAGAGGDFGQIAAFQFASYTDQVAVLQLVSRFPNGGYQAVTVTVRWYRGDWRLQLLPDGAMSETAQQLSNLVGFIPWGGV